MAVIAMVVHALWLQRTEHMRVGYIRGKDQVLEKARTLLVFNSLEKRTATYVQNLDLTHSTRSVLDSLEQACASRGTLLTAVSTQSKDASQTTLSRDNIKATLNGSYANIKLVLSDVMQQFPGLLVQQIVMRKMTSPTDVQAQVDLLLVSRPVESPAPLQ